MNHTNETTSTEPLKLDGLNLENPAMLIKPEAFAFHLAVSNGVVGGWIDAGYLPTVKIGKHRLINLVQLKQLLESASPTFNGFNRVVS